ncbi:porphobilinogen deaminase [Penicillium chermesinum]|uniref:hydroxymethylbilane synthase n=1 Tax=Penicillium chermesinum TaxID=63820 RepID=A0A9W9PFY6_9EURO|nr:porphobilinogen deaminase [Penicillium chermesinum]KAJ5245969.1 porphobilinogen deaminase [Penicillium chermesinum]
MTGSETQRKLVVGTRKSKLAIVQAEHVSAVLASAHPQIQFPWQTVSVSGDVDKQTPFLKFGGPSDAGKNIWTEGLEAKLSSGEVDLLVNCLKDMPTVLPDDCFLGAIVHREDPTDALVVKASLKDQYTDLSQLPPGSVVGTSSTRRKALLKYKYPHLEIQECRGNIDSRIRKLDEPGGPYTAIILATAGLNRIHLTERITKHLPPSEFPYAVGQGALGIEVRKDDAQVLNVVRAIEEPLTRWICLAERALLRTLKGGCSSPVAVNSVAESGNNVRLQAMIIHPHGVRKVSGEAVAVLKNDTDAEALGSSLAKRLEGEGGLELLEEIRLLNEAEMNAGQSKR